jgi:hypothetical protein
MKDDWRSPPSTATTSELTEVSSKGTVFQHDELLKFIEMSKGSAVVRDDPDVLVEKKDIWRR